MGYGGSIHRLTLIVAVQYRQGPISPWYRHIFRGILGSTQPWDGYDKDLMISVNLSIGVHNYMGNWVLGLSIRLWGFTTALDVLYKT